MTAAPERAGLRAWRAGEEVARLEAPPITRATLALFAGASGDHNPIHIDIDAARSAGLPDVIAHGMLVMAYLGRCLTTAAPQDRVSSFSARFVAMTQVGETITCRAVVAPPPSAEWTDRARLALTAHDAAGELKIAGEAIIDLEEMPA